MDGIEEMEATNPVAELMDLLDEEARVLRAAAFEALPALAEAKAALAARIEAGEGGRAGLPALAEKVRRNQGSLKAAIGGVRAARLRLDELQRVAEGLGTYDREGRKTSPGPGKGRMERRA